jgi:hypothetical protein
MLISQRNKIWLGLVLFFVPEVLWTGAISSFIGLSFIPVLNSTKFFSAYPLFGYLLILVEAIGLILLSLANYAARYKHIVIKYVFALPLLASLVAILILFYYGYVFAYRVSFP